jgi:cardiolipin synthase (CMP-forming)
VAGVEDVDDLDGVRDATHDVRDVATPPSEEPEEGLDRILTVPNVITLLRLLCIPVFLWLLFGLHEQTAAAILLAVLGATDWVDGYVARRFKQVSTFGKVLDPTADRLLVGTAVIVVIVHGAVPVWFGVVTLVREALVGLMVLVLAGLGAARIDVVWVGKAGTFGLMGCLPLFLATDGPGGWEHPLRVVTYVLVVPALVLSWYAAASYLPMARQALREGRAPRCAAG